MTLKMVHRHGYIVRNELNLFTNSPIIQGCVRYKVGESSSFPAVSFLTGKQIGREVRYCEDFTEVGELSEFGDLARNFLEPCSRFV